MRVNQKNQEVLVAMQSSQKMDQKDKQLNSVM